MIALVSSAYWKKQLVWDKTYQQLKLTSFPPLKTLRRSRFRKSKSFWNLGSGLDTCCAASDDCVDMSSSTPSIGTLLGFSSSLSLRSCCKSCRLCSCSRRLSFSNSVICTKCQQVRIIPMLPAYNHITLSSKLFLVASWSRIIARNRSISTVRFSCLCRNYVWNKQISNPQQHCLQR